MPSTAIRDEGDSIVFSDGKRAPKSQFSASSLAKFADQIDKLRGNNVPNALRPGGFMSNFINEDTVTGVPQVGAPSAAMPLPTPQIAPGMAVDLNAPPPTVPQAPLLGQQPTPAAPALQAPAPPTQAQPQTQGSGGMPTVENMQQSVSYQMPDKEAQAKRERAQADYEASILDGAKEGAKVAAAQSVIRDQASADAQRQAEKAANDQLVFDNQLELANQDRIKAQNELMSFKKDPDRFWKERGTGARIAAGIAVALGAFGSALTGSRNTAFDLINQAIERDLDAQEADYRVKRDRVNIADNSYAQMRQRGLDERVARDSIRSLGLQSTAAKLEAAAAKSGDKLVMAKANEEVQRLRTAAAASDESAARRTIQIVKARQPALTAEQMQKMSEDERERYVPSIGGLAPTKALAQKLVEYDASNADVVGQLNDLKSLVDKHGNESFGHVSNEMEGMYMRAITTMKELEKLGVLSGPDEKLLRAQVADPTNFFGIGSNTSKRLGSLIQHLNASRERVFRRYGMLK